MPNGVYEIDRLYLALHTRDEEDAASTEAVRLFSGNTEIAVMDPPPPRGKSGMLEASVSLFYPVLLDAELSLGLTGADPWGPRSAFLWGRLVGGYEPDYVPLAENLDAVPYAWVSQNVAQGSDRWSLRTLRYLDWSGSISEIVLCLETMADWVQQQGIWWMENVVLPGFSAYNACLPSKSYKRLLASLETIEIVQAEPIAPPGTTGPIDLSLQSENGTSWGGSNVWSGGVSFQTTLARRGRQEPAESGGCYLAHFYTSFLGNFAGVHRHAYIRNRSDDPWRPTRAWLFAVGGNMGSEARLLGVDTNIRNWCSQDPHLSETVRCAQGVYLPKAYSVLDY